MATLVGSKREGQPQVREQSVLFPYRVSVTNQLCAVDHGIWVYSTRRFFQVVK